MLKIPPVVLAFFLCTPLSAWHDEGHVYIATAAVEALPEEVPAFLRDEQAARTVAHLSLDPDVQKHRDLRQLDPAEHPQHFIDLEYLEGHPLPPTRPEFITLMHQLGHDPQAVGYLPYQITELTQRLAYALAEHRQHPESEIIRQKSLFYAGLLAHYAGDASMPLHTSVHWDGRAERRPDGSYTAPRTGIHGKIDALPTHLAYDAIFDEPLAPMPEWDAKLAPDARPADRIMMRVQGALRVSHALLDQAYELEPLLPPQASPGGIENAEVRAFARERVRAGAELLRDLVVEAWRMSGELEPHDWMDREAFDSGFDRSKPIPQRSP